MPTNRCNHRQPLDATRITDRLFEVEVPKNMGTSGELWVSLELGGNRRQLRVVCPPGRDGTRWPFRKPSHQTLRFELPNPAARVSCPVCRRVFSDNDHNSPVLPSCISHGAIRLFATVSDECALCLAPPTDKNPGMALPCGHVVCREDFVRLGGVAGVVVGAHWHDDDCCLDLNTQDAKPIVQAP